MAQGRKVDVDGKCVVKCYIISPKAYFQQHKGTLRKIYKDAVLPFILFTLNVLFNYKNNCSPLENGGR